MGGPGSGRKKGCTLDVKPKRHPNQLSAVAVAADHLPYDKKIAAEADKFSAMVRRAKEGTR